MAERFRSSEDDRVHFGSPDGNDYFLCGLAYEGADGLADIKAVKRRVDCEQCIGIVRFCKTVKAHEMIGQISP